MRTILITVFRVAPNLNLFFFHFKDAIYGFQKDYFAFDGTI